MKNQFQAQAWMFDLVCNEELSPDSAFQRIRREDPETFAELNQKQRGPNGPVSMLEMALEKLAHEWKSAHGPAARAYMKLTNRELGLRGDIQMALLNIDTTDPRDLREILRLVQLVAARETWQGQTQPADLLEALDCLEAANVDCSKYRAALDEMYPMGGDDEDDEVAQPAA